MNNTPNNKSKPLMILILGASTAFIAWWLYIALIGAVVGLVASKKWGYGKSLVGRALLFFSFGLFAQEFGQLSYSYYLYVLHGEIPYPSIGDIGYFGSVLFYTYGVVLLARASGIKFGLTSMSKKLIAGVVPLALLIASYLFFLKGYEFDFSSASAVLRVFLDFGYPFGQAIYIAIALLTLLFSQKLLGGIMRNKVLMLIAALVVQYIADFSFLEAVKLEKAFPAGANDLMYLLAYALMSLALLTFVNTNLGGAPTPVKEADKHVT
jgi:hypothetical protein